MLQWNEYMSAWSKDHLCFDLQMASIVDGQVNSIGKEVATEMEVSVYMTASVCVCVCVCVCEHVQMSVCYISVISMWMWMCISCIFGVDPPTRSSHCQRCSQT